MAHTDFRDILLSAATRGADPDRPFFVLSVVARLRGYPFR